MLSNMSYKDIMNDKSCQNKFVLCMVTTRNIKSKFAEGFMIMQKYSSKLSADKKLKEVLSQGYDACVIPVFDNPDNGYSLEVKDGEVIKSEQLITPEDYARFFRTYYNLER